MISNFVTGGHAITVVGYYASHMIGEARKLWNENKEQFSKVFKSSQKEVVTLDKFLTEGVNMRELYDVIKAKKILDELFELGRYMGEYSTGEHYKQAPKGGEDFSFYLVEGTQALYSGLELLDKLNPSGESDITASYMDDLYQSL